MRALRLAMSYDTFCVMNAIFNRLVIDFDLMLPTSWRQ